MDLRSLRLIACDVDGTLFNSRGKIGTKTKETLMQLQKQGVKIAICSGRAPFELQEIVEELALEHYGGFLLHGNGAGIYDVAKKQNYQFPQLQPKQLRYAIQVAHAMHLYVIVYQKGRYLCSYSPSIALGREIAKRLYQQLRNMKQPRIRQFAYMSKNATMVEHLELHMEEPSNKVCIRGRPSTLRKAHRVIDAHCPNQFNYFYLSEGSLEITHHQVSKAKALHYLCEQQCYDISQVIAFGDSNNDDEMLSSIPYGVAMGNAFASTKKAASYVTKSNDEDGIAEFLSEFKIS